MENEKFYSIPVKTFAFEDTKNSQFLKTKFFAIAEGDNLNMSAFELEGMQNCIDENDYTFKPILGSWDKEKSSENGLGNFGGHDSDLEYDTMSGEIYNTYLGEKNERPLGLILPNSAKIETFKGKNWMTFEGLIWSEYNREAVRLLKKRRSNNVSVEIKVIKSDMDERGYEIIKEFSLLGITIIGVDAGIPDAHLNIMDFSATKQFSNFVKVFSKEYSNLEGENMEVFLKQDKYGSSETLQVALTKEDASNDAWGPINKTKLRNDLLKAKNYKTIIPKSYLVVMEGWEEAPSEKLKYPIVQIKEGKVVLNINGVQTASSYLMKEKDSSYFRNAKAKLNRIRKILDMEKLMSLEFGLETNEGWGEEASQNQPNIIKMEGGKKSKMEKTEIISKLSKSFADKNKFAEELKSLNSIYEEKLGIYEYAEEDVKENAKAEMEASKEDIAKKEEEIKTCEKEIIELSNELVGIEEDEIDEKERDDENFPEEDDEDEEYPDDEDKKHHYTEKVEEGCKFVSASKNYIVYEKDGELYASKYSCGEEGDIKVEEAIKCEKIYASFVVGGPLSKEDSSPMPRVNVSISKGILNAFAEIKDKDIKMAEIEKDAKEKVELAEKDKENFKIDVKSMLTKFEDITCEENVSKEFKNDVYSKIFDNSYSNVEDLETKVKASLYELNKTNKFLNGSFVKNVNLTKNEETEQDKINNFIKSYK